ncbi:MAG TPA: hypothetical protein VMF30_11205 [Pirellulales bacterium]|nr:hypothetical protein [Pirellulales bacterium]
MKMQCCCACALTGTLLLLSPTVRAAEPVAPPATALAALPAATAAPAPPAPAAAEAPPAAVPLTRVVVFNSGVGFFDRQGEIDGDVAVALKFNAADINDLLKSLVVEDRGGGQISAVTYGSKDPLTKTLKKFAIDLTDNPTLAGILNQIRGERIEFAAPGPMSGTLLGVETREQDAGPNRQPLKIEIMNVLTDDGLRSIPLTQVGAIKLANAQLDKEFRQALAVLASGHDADKKSVTLRFSGQGRRPVRVGYIQNMPIWKTSYRLVLDDRPKAQTDAKDDKPAAPAGKLTPLLQGWAIVENTTEEDWHDVRLTLVSGRPVSFIMNLYDPLYVQRPTVQPELYAGLRPQVYSADLDVTDNGVAFEQGHVAAEEALKHESSPQSWQELSNRRKLYTNSLFRNEAFLLENKGPASEATKHFSSNESDDLYGYITLQGAQSVATSGDLGELFQYSIVPPVTLARQESAMLPIVDEHVEGQKLSVYNAAIQPKHPLSGLRLANTTKLHLMQGPITVFEGGAYAGDAQIEDVAPGTSRLLTYAVDLDVECTSETASTSDQIDSVWLKKGIMLAEHKQVRTQKYKLKNSDDRARTIIVEHPITPDWNLVTPKEPAEKTRSAYRFSIDVEPKKSAALEVVEEHMLRQEVQLASSNDDLIRFFRSQRSVSADVKAALEKIVEMKAALASLAEQRKQLDAQLKTITDEQQRIRQNMQQLDRTSDLYKRYVKKFGDQEDTVEQLGKDVKHLADQEATQHKALDDFLLGLDVK